MFVCCVLPQYRCTIVICVTSLLQIRVTEGLAVIVNEGGVSFVDILYKDFDSIV